MWILLVGYTVFVLCDTVLCRDSFQEYKYSLIPFWSYAASLEKPYLITQNLLNVVLFIPLGCLLKGLNKGLPWWKLLLILSLFSVSIESLQLILKKGFCEFDDVFHNALGGLLGCYVSSLLTKQIGG